MLNCRILWLNRKINVIMVFRMDERMIQLQQIPCQRLDFVDFFCDFCPDFYKIL